MKMQQPVQPRPSASGYGRRKVDREMGTRLENKVQSGKTTSRPFTGVGEGGAYQILSCDRLVFLSACLVGHQVEVQVMDGSVFSGILHATNTEKDFGIILKMAYLVKDSSEGMKNTSETFSKPPLKTLIIPGKEFVQVTAKGVPTTFDGFRTEFMLQQQQELLTDSCISQSRHIEVERQLERWVPDDDAPECPELDNIFDGHWNRGWDQFEANERLFGVKSTFDEDFYTTKLQKGPQMSELEKEALRIAREIEGEDTRDLHLAEERGIQLHENLEVDEETKFSAVVRAVDDSSYDDCEDILFDSRNDETFQGISGAMGKSSIDMNRRKMNDVAQVSSRSSFMIPEEARTSVLEGAASTSADNGLLRTSSVNSFSSEKFTLNPHAKEFKLNPNAKSFFPSQSPLRPASPVSDNSFYYPAGVSTVPNMHGMPVGVGPSFSAHQPVLFNPHATPVPQPFFHPNGPQYGQQMMIGHPRQVVYMPSYPAEMPFKGREY